MGDRRNLMQKIKNSKNNELKLNSNNSNENYFADKMSQMLKNCRVKRDRSEGMNETVVKTRQIYLINYSIGVKNDEIQRLKKALESERKKISSSKHDLSIRCENFTETLKKSDKTTMEALKRADLETTTRLNKQEEINKLKSQVYALNLDLNAVKESLEQLLGYRDFAGRVYASFKRDLLDEGSHENESLDEFKTKPSILSKVFEAIESENLKLIIRNQEISETLDDIKVMNTLEQFKLDQEIELIEDTNSSITESIEREQKKAADFETKARLFSFGEFNQADQDRILTKLNDKTLSITENISKFNMKLMALRKSGESEAADVNHSANKNILFQINKNGASSNCFALLAQFERQIDRLLELKSEINPPERFQKARQWKEREWREIERESKAQKIKEEQAARVERSKKLNEEDRKNKNANSSTPNKRHQIWNEVKKKLAEATKPPSNLRKEKSNRKKSAKIKSDLKPTNLSNNKNSS